jgi:hypothetical protein
MLALAKSFGITNTSPPIAHAIAKAKNHIADMRNPSIDRQATAPLCICRRLRFSCTAICTPFVELDEEPHRADRLDVMSDFWNHDASCVRG